MKKYIILTLIAIWGVCSLQAQEKLSRKQKRALKTQQKAQAIQSGIHKGQLRVVANKLITAQGRQASARGGILFLRASEAEFMEFWYVDAADKEVSISTNFQAVGYTKQRTTTEGVTVVTFSGNVKGSIWQFKLEIESLGELKMFIMTSTGHQLTYFGKVKNL